MAKVQKTVITALGEQMLFSSALTYTDATLCSQDVSNLTTDQLRALTDLTGKVLSSPISAHKRQGNTKADQVDVQVTFTNRDQKTDINYSSIGWFARDRQGHETLIAVTPFIGTDTIAAAPPDGTATSSKNITLSMAVGTATEINVLIDPAGSVTPSTFNTEVDKINEALALKADNAELADYAKKADVNSALDAKADKTALDPLAKSEDVAKDVETLNSAINLKADKTDLAPLAKTEDVNTELDKKADKTALDPLAKSEDVAKDVETLNSAINLKADKTDLAPLAKTEDVNTELDKKADKTALDPLAKSEDVAKDVETLNSAINLKADKTDLAPLAKTEDVNTELDKKADKTALDPLAKSEDVAKDVETLNSAINLKADKTDLAPLAKTEDVNTELDKKADKTALDPLAKSEDVAKDVETLNSAINLKADKTDLAPLAKTEDVNTELDKKADKTALDPLAKSEDVAKDVETLNSAINLKADKTDLAPLAKTEDVNTELDKKADKTALDPLAKSEDVAKDVETLNSAINLKADKTDLAPLAKTEDVNTELDKKADKTALDPLAKSEDVAKDVETLNSAINLKADKTDLAPLAKTEDVNTELDKKADKTALDPLAKSEDVAKDVETLNSAINLKADKTDLAPLAKTEDVNTELDKKADKTALDPLAKSEDVAKDVETLNSAINLKADKTDLAPLAKTEDVNTELDKKADKTALDPLAKSEDVAKDVETLNSAINLKADKTDLAPLAKTEDVNTELDKKADKTALDDYAKSSDVAADVKQLTDSIATKADAKTVDDAIDKIDFTPYAKTADVQAELDTKANTTDLAPFARSVDVNKQIEGVSTAVTNASNTEQADIDKINKVLATKRDITDSYSKDQLDKKFLELSTDTGGKVDANQVATMIENKADKSDVTKQIGTITDLVNTKANSTDVDAALDKKDDTTDVDAKIKIVTDLANTKADKTDVTAQFATKADKTTVEQELAVKANSDDVYSKTEANNLITDAKNTGKQAQATADSALAGYNKRPVISGGDSDDLLAFKTTQLRYYPGNGNTCKNLPPATNQRWFTVEYIFENPYGDGIAIYRSPANEIWTIGNNSGRYDPAWVKVANANDIQGLQNQINTKADTATVNSQVADAKNAATKAQDTANQAINTKANSSDVYVRKDVDSAFSEVRDRIGKLEGTQTLDSPDFNGITASGIYYITNNNGANIKNNPVDQWGVLIVSNGNGHRVSQVYYPDDGNPPWYRSLDESTWHNWIQLSTKQDVNNATNLANAASNKIDTVLANSYVRKQGMNANGDCIEIKHTGIKQANGGYAFDMWNDDWTASKLQDVIKNQLPSKANTADVNNALNDKANAGDVSALQNKVNVNTPLFREISADSTWEDIFGVTNPNNVLTSLRINPGGNGQLVNDYAAGIGFGGKDTKAVISVDYGSHVARFTAGDGVSPGWSEDVAWKSDISSLTQALTKLQAAFDAQQTKIAALQATVNNQANQLTYFKQHYIEGKAFDADQIKQAMAWTGDDGQKLAIIRDKENEGGK